MNIDSDIRQLRQKRLDVFLCLCQQQFWKFQLFLSLLGGILSGTDEVVLSRCRAPFMSAELDYQLREMKPKKAPEPDGVTNEMLRHV